jgi:pre-mRNA-splicing factor SYF2/beta-D-xylosidase 4
VSLLPVGIVNSVQTLKGFDGYITSDCDADADVYNKHHYLNWTVEETVAGVLKAGTDVDCTSFVGKNAQSALDKGLITEADIDIRLKNLFKVRP